MYSSISILLYLCMKISIIHYSDCLDELCMRWLCVQVTQLCLTLDALLGSESSSAEVLECYFLEALYCSLGATLLESGRIQFDEFIKRLSCLTAGHDEKALAGPGEIPGKEQTWIIKIMAFLICLSRFSLWVTLNIADNAENSWTRFFFGFRLNE